MKRKFNIQKKRICILRSNPVNPDSRVEKEAKALEEAGYYVHILSWDRDSNHKPRKEYINNGTIPITRLGYKAGYSEGIRCIKPRFRFQFSMVFWILKYGRKFDVIHACDIDTALFSYFPSRLTGCKFVFDLFDFICGDPKNLAQRIVRCVEIWLINRADVTIICTEQRRKQIRGTHPKQLLVIHNSPDESLISDNVSLIVNKEKLSVVYVGVLLKNRLLKEIVNYFTKHPEMDFYIGGFGIMEDYVRKAANRYDNIHFVGRIPYEETLALEQQCDVMIAVYDPSIENHQMAAPNKFYESLMLGKPIIMAKGTGMSDVVEENNIGVLIDYSEDGFAEGIRKIVERKDDWNEMSVQMNRLYEDKYSWKIMKDKFIRMYQSLL